MTFVEELNTHGVKLLNLLSDLTPSKRQTAAWRLTERQTLSGRFERMTGLSDSYELWRRRQDWRVRLRALFSPSFRKRLDEKQAQAEASRYHGRLAKLEEHEWRDLHEVKKDLEAASLHITDVDASGKNYAIQLRAVRQFGNVSFSANPAGRELIVETRPAIAEVIKEKLKREGVELNPQGELRIGTRSCFSMSLRSEKIKAIGRILAEQLGQESKEQFEPPVCPLK